MSKIKIETMNKEGIEELFIGFEKKMLKDFRKGVSSDGQGQVAIEWIMKHSDANELTAASLAEKFLTRIMDGF